MSHAVVLAHAATPELAHAGGGARLLWASASLQLFASVFDFVASPCHAYKILAFAVTALLLLRRQYES